MIVLKRFQEEAINSAVSYFKNTLTLLAATSGMKENIVKKAGYCLLEAPTGAGKTLIAGHVAEQISKSNKIIWFWFTPFVGLVGQAEKTIKDEFPKLSLKNLYKERQIEKINSGDIFVTTWASVASSKKSSRRIRQATEIDVGLDEYIELAKLQGYNIGVIIDESHHSFKAETEAQKFFTSILNPSLSLLITATPNDKDIEAFQKLMEIEKIEKLSISRVDCVKANLIKKGIKATTFLTDKWTGSLIDLNKTALSQGCEIHNSIKKKLEDEELEVTPLMLVQVDSSSNSIERTKKYLYDLGFSEEQIAVHTADEPDPNLISIAHDESIEVLIFKMAVALGFDAPRAFTLVSLRSSRDVGFGIQIVGRILRVDRRLQRIIVPKELNYGYVVMIDENTQTGLSSAADRINSIKTELSTASPNVTLIDMLGKEAELIMQPTENHKGNLLSLENANNNLFQRKMLYDEENHPNISVLGEIGKNNIFEEQFVMHTESFIYNLNSEIDIPQLYREKYSLKQKDIVPCIAKQINFSDNIFSVLLKDSTKIIKKEIEIFEHLESIQSSLAYLSKDKITQKAQEIIFSKEFLDGNKLYFALVERMRSELFSRGITMKLDNDFVESGLNIAIVMYPEILDEAIKKCMVSFIEMEPVTLPKYISSDIELKHSRLNIYGVYPDDMNRWETEFSRLLDHDTTGDILWWHRNPVRRTYSISVVDENLQYDFYPDFVVGIKDRQHGKNILLVEIKGTINRDKNELFKAQSSHKLYKDVMVLHWEDERSWHIVRFDPKQGMNILDQRFRIELMSDF